MKKLLFSILLTVFVLSACTQTETVKEKELSTDAEETSEEQANEQGDDESIAQEEQQAEESGGEETNAQDDNAEEGDQPKEPLYELNPANWTLDPIEDANEKVVLLTFDDAPDKHALGIAEKLLQLDVQAIFFVNGHFIDTEEEKQTLKEIADMGFPIGNHTMTHSRLDKMSEQQQHEEIIGLNDQIEAITGERPKFFRAPFGVNTDYSKKIVQEDKMLLMNWTFGYDWEKDYMNKDALADIMVNTPLLTNGANLLMHDREWTMEAIDEIVKGLQGKGYDILDPALIKMPHNE